MRHALDRARQFHDGASRPLCQGYYTCHFDTAPFLVHRVWWTGWQWQTHRRVTMWFG